MTGRMLGGFFLLGAALAFCWRGDWLAAGLAFTTASVSVVAQAVARFRDEMATTRTQMRAFAEMAAVADRMLADSRRRARRVPL